MSDDEKDEAIYRVETVPPPAGESDAYNAPTRVGPMAAAVVEEMMHAAVRKSTELSQRAEEKRAAIEGQAKARGAATPSAPPKSEPVRRRPPSAAPSVTASKPPAPAPVSRPTSTTAKMDGASPSKNPARLEGSGYSFGTAELIHDVASSPPSKPAVQSLPRVYDDEDAEDNAATMLSRAAKAPVVEPIAPPPPRLPFVAAPPVSTNNTGARPAVPSTPRVAPIASQFPFAIAEPESAQAIWLPVVVGFAIFLTGLALYLWAR